MKLNTQLLTCSFLSRMMRFLRPVVLLAILAACLLHQSTNATEVEESLVLSESVVAPTCPPSPTGTPCFTDPNPVPISVLPSGPTLPRVSGITVVTPLQQLQPTAQEIAAIVQRKTVCPFLGAALTSRLLPIFSTLRSPYTLATSIRDLGNTGGGDLGDVMYNVAVVNFPNPEVLDDELDEKARPTSQEQRIHSGGYGRLGYSTLSIAGSILAHRGHSGMLAAMNSSKINSGQYNAGAWTKLLAKFTIPAPAAAPSPAVAPGAPPAPINYLPPPPGHISVYALCLWIAENQMGDSESTPYSVASLNGHIMRQIAMGVPRVMTEKYYHPNRLPAEKLLRQEEELVPIRKEMEEALASSLFAAAVDVAFLVSSYRNSPRTLASGAGRSASASTTAAAGGAPSGQFGPPIPSSYSDPRVREVLEVELHQTDLETLFVRRALVPDWQSWPKRKADFLKYLPVIARTATTELIRMRGGKLPPKALAEAQMGHY
jgi:hypothetical protein